MCYVCFDCKSGQKERGRENDDVDGDDDDDDEWQKLLPCVWSFVSTLMEFTTQ